MHSIKQYYIIPARDLKRRELLMENTGEVIKNTRAALHTQAQLKVYYISRLSHHKLKAEAQIRRDALLF